MADEPILVKTFNEDLDVEGKLSEGGVLANLYLEVQGNDKEAAEKALEAMVFTKMASEPFAKLLEVKLFDLKPDDEGKYYSGVVEVKLVTDDFRWFVNLIMRYGPTAIEVIEPDEVHLSSDQMHSLVADVSEITQSLSARILSMLSSEERRKLYDNMVSQ